MDMKANAAIPAAYIPFIKCAILGTNDLGETVSAICTSNGQLLEFCNKKLINGCEIDCEDAKQMFHFISYEPITKYYLVQTSSQLIVVIRQKELKVHKIYEDVKSVQIKDQMELGWPQIVIDMENVDSPFITDLVGKLESCHLPKVQSETSICLNHKLQESSLRLKNAQNLLQEKRTCRMNAMIQLAAHLRGNSSNIKDPSQVSILSKTLAEKISTAQTSQIRVLSPWQRVFCGKWIVGFPMYNGSKSKVYDMGLILNGDFTSIQYKRHFFIMPQVHDEGLRWTDITPQAVLFQPAKDLPGEASGTMICVLDVPAFANDSSKTLFGIIVYKDEKSISKKLQQIHASPVTLSVSDLVQGTLQSFSSLTSNTLECDLLSAIVVCTCCKLEVTFAQPTQQCLEEKLEQNLGFIRLPSINHFVCKCKGALEDVVVHIDHSTEWKYTVSVHSSDNKTTLLFIHSLQDMLPQHTKINRLVGSAASLEDVISSLNSELLLVLNTVTKFNNKQLPLTDANTIHISADIWAELKDQLFEKELLTDKLCQKIQNDDVK